MSGLRKVWVRSPRETSESRDRNGKTVALLGKNGGPVIRQHVELRLVPKERP